MPALRAQAKAAIDADISAGLLWKWQQVETLILPFPRGDVHLEGEELEASLVPGEKPYDDDSDEESELEDDDDEVLAPISDAAAARPAADPPLPPPAAHPPLQPPAADPPPAADLSLTADAPSPAADPSLTANGKERAELEAKRRRLADYKAMLATTKAMPLPDPALLSFLESRVQTGAKVLHLVGSTSVDAVFYEEAAAQHAAAKNQLKALQEQVREADTKKLEEKRAKRAKTAPGKKEDKYQVLAHMLPLPEPVQLAIDTENARRASKVASQVSDQPEKVSDQPDEEKKEEKEKKEKKDKKEKEKKEKKDKKEKDKKEKKDKKAKDKKEKKEKKEKKDKKEKKETDKDKMSKGEGKVPEKGKEDKKAAKAAPSGHTRSACSVPMELVFEAKGAAAKVKSGPSAFEAQDLGNNHENGGSRLHKRNRLEALCQLRNVSETLGLNLSPESCSHWDAFLVWQEQKWMQDFQGLPSRSRSLGAIVYNHVRRWESELLGKGNRSFADYVDAKVQRLLMQAEK